MNKTPVIDERTVYIYTLIDPRDDKVRYVGATLNIKATVSRHISQPVNKKKTAWIAELKSQKLRPRIEVVDTATVPTRLEVERKWVSHYLRLGADLLNWEYAPEFDRSQAKLPPKHYDDLLVEFEELWKPYEVIPSDIAHLTRNRFLIGRALEIAIEALKQRQQLK